MREQAAVLVPSRHERSPEVSVVMPAKNEEMHIGVAIESVLQQTFKNIELIVIDDHSCDRTAAIVESFRDPRIILYRKTSEPPGQATSKNVGIRLARGAFIAYHDADDVSHETRIEVQLGEAMAGLRPRVVGSWVEYREGRTSTILRLPTDHEGIVKGLLRSWNRVTFVSGTMLFPRSVGLAVINRSQFKSFEDWDQVCRIREAGIAEFRNVPKVLYTYTVRPKGSKGQPDWSRYNVYERACRARRLAGLAEWQSIQEFEAYLRRAPRENLRWIGLRQLLEVKVRIQRRRMKQPSR